MTKLNSVSSVSHDSSEIWVIHSCLFFVCLVIVVHESLVCPEQFNCQQINRLLFFRKILQVPQILICPAFLCIWTLSNNDCMILRSIFSHWGQLRDSRATITEGSNHALRARGWKLLNRMEMCTFFLFCLNVIFCHLVLTFRGYRR